MSIIDKFLDVMRLNDDDYEFDNEDYDYDEEFDDDEDDDKPSARKKLFSGCIHLAFDTTRLVLRQ